MQAKYPAVWIAQRTVKNSQMIDFGYEDEIAEMFIKQPAI